METWLSKSLGDPLGSGGLPNYRAQYNHLLSTAGREEFKKVKVLSSKNLRIRQAWDGSTLLGFCTLTKLYSSIMKTFFSPLWKKH